MLILQRRLGEEIVIRCPSGEVIRVVLTRIRDRERARIGVEASRNVEINRREVHEKKYKTKLPDLSGVREDDA